MIGEITPRLVAVQGLGGNVMQLATQGLADYFDSTQAMPASLQSITDNHGILETLLIDHASFSSPVRVVNDTRDWRIAGETYVGLPFRLKLPSQVQNENPRASIQLDNVGRSMTALVEGLPVGQSLTATLRVSSRYAPSDVAFEFVGELSNISLTPSVMTCNFGLEDTMRQSAVRIRFDPTSAPALFAG